MQTLLRNLAALTLSIFITVPTQGVDYTWNIDGNGDWGTATNWDPVGIPGLGDTILIRNTITPANPVIVSVGSGITREIAGVTIEANGATPHELLIPNNTILDVHGDIMNNGRLMLNSSGSATLLRADGADVSLTGGGRLVLGSNGSNGISATGNRLVTNGASHTVEGSGGFGSNLAVVENLGLIDANVSGQQLVLDPRNNGVGIVTFTNNSIAQASNGGTLRLTGNGGGEHGGTGTYQALGGSEVVINNSAVVRDSTFDTISNGLVRIADGDNVFFENITNNGNFQVGNNTDAQMFGTITNTGEITLASVAQQSDFELGGNVVLTGGGTLTLTGPVAQINSIGNFSLTNADNTIQGNGNVGGNTALIINDNLIDANVSGETLLLDPRNIGAGNITFTNNSIAQASNGGTLRLTGNGGGEHGGTGTYQALAGSEVVINNGAVVRNSTFDTTSTGIVRTGDGDNVFFVNITNNGNFQVGNSTDAQMFGTITNTGEITLASVSSQSDFELGGNVVLTGGGTLSLNGPIAQINSVGNFSLTNVNNLIQGNGNIGGNTAVIINDSLIDANVSGENLVLDPRNNGAVVTFTNNSIAQASNGGTLLLTGNGGGEHGGTGTYQALADSEVVIANSAFVRDSTFDTTGNGVVRTGDGDNVFFVDITNNGKFQVGNNTDARMFGTITNTDEITLASVAQQSDFELGGDVVLTGGGTLSLTGPVAQINSVGNFSLTNVNNTIQGNGNIGGNTAVVINRGVIDAANAGQTLTIDPRNNGAGTATFVNESGGVVRARSGGTIVLSGLGGGELLNHDGGRFIVESTAQLVNSAVFRNGAGGRVEGNGTIDIVSGTFANGGVVAPGLSVGVLSVTGTYNQDANGTLEVELGGPTPGTEHDQLAVTGIANLDGTLDIVTVASLADPVSRGTVDEFMVLSATAINGAFAVVNYDGAALTPLSGVNPLIAYDGLSDGGLDGMFRGVTYSDTSATFFNYLSLGGDANGDRTVDGQDFIIWNQSKFTAGNTWTTGDFNGDGLTDGLDFIIWNQNKFTSVDMLLSTGPGLLAVPEPECWCLMLLPIAGLISFRRR